MKGNHLRRMFFLAVAVSLLLAVIWLVVEPVRASLGNRGVPVRCQQSGSSIPVGEARFLDCVAADGTPFTDGQRVPNSYYLLVTDVVVSKAPPNGSLWAYLRLYDVIEDDSRDYSLVLQSSGNPSTFSAHFTTPYFVLPAGHRLEGENWGSSGSDIKVFVSGLLVTNVIYLPLITSN